MAASQPQFIDVGEGNQRRRIAHLRQPATTATSRKPEGPGLIWLQGFKSDMISTKATALAEWTKARGLAFTRFDYSGHGQSEGRFEDGTIGAWLDEADTVFRMVTTGPQVLVGSSMGGWIALLLLQRLLKSAPDEAERIKALVLIAPAWDMTEELMWNTAPEDVRRGLERTGVYLRPSAYGDGPYPITMKLINEGRNHLIAGEPFDPGRPVRIIHGRLDPDVPFSHSQALRDLLLGGRIAITEISDGEHRLSRPQDLAALFAILAALT